MKVIIAGATGFVGTELLRQSLRMPSITSVVAFSRRPIDTSGSIGQPGADLSKLKSITIDAYDKYSDEAKAEFGSADACIWTVAITPSKSSLYDWDEVRRICHESPLACLQAALESRSSGENASREPLRFIYMSGATAERDQTKTPSYKPKYTLLRGETENAILALTKQHHANIQACIVKSGFIVAPNDLLKIAFGFALKWVASVPTIDVREISAAMLDQATTGFDKDTLDNGDLIRLGHGKV